MNAETDRVEADKAWRTFKHWLFRECNEGTRRHLWAAFGLPTDEIRNHGTEYHALRYVRRQLLADQQAEIERLRKEAREQALQFLATDGQAIEALARAEQAEAELERWKDVAAGLSLAESDTSAELAVAKRQLAVMQAAMVEAVRRLRMSAEPPHRSVELVCALVAEPLAPFTKGDSE
ncbi:hypothetical protein ACFOON_15090 [Novosphingobium piscinae]|uniref:Uncharacterized protein n=1 Tax=Novosphingobium piscinae TaxID=1507448 RepID=A0A7X1KPJ1_9SPHN|nr:hypothetical protein [Novosphingobium piscinae]MBC2668774.1 hypothetical protein [Novosphingobium piscinae]